MSRIVVAYYTEDTPYVKIKDTLVASLREYNLPFDIRSYPNRGSWVANCAIKPTFIYEMIQLYPEILYVDCDAVFRGPLEYDFKGDIGVCILNNRELLSGTIFLNDSQKVRDILKLWIIDQKYRPDVWDQRTLRTVLDAQTKRIGLNVVSLENKYCKIFDNYHQNCQPVIEHFQASRKYRNTILPTIPPTQSLP